MSLCEDCIKGVRHEGTPEGKWETINGIECYVATPSDAAFQKDAVLLYLADIFGAQSPNAQLLADDFARNGIKTVMPDYLSNDPIPVEVWTDEEKRKTLDIQGWLSHHGATVTRGILDKAIAGLKDQGITKFAATGFCFGGRYVFDLAFDNIISVSIASHPSMLKSPEDLEKYFSTSRAPLLLNTCTIDEQFPQSAQSQADAIFGGGKFAPGYKREYFDGCTHGFAVRGDLSDPKVKAGKEGAFDASVKWLNEYGFGSASSGDK